MAAHLRENFPALQPVMIRAILFAATLLILITAESSGKEKRLAAPRHHTLTLESAISLALKQNPDVLKAIHEIERTRIVWHQHHAALTKCAADAAILCTKLKPIQIKTSTRPSPEP